MTTPKGMTSKLLAIFKLFGFKLPRANNAKFHEYLTVCLELFTQRTQPRPGMGAKKMNSKKAAAKTADK